VAGAAQGDRARRDASGGHSGPHHRRRPRPVRCPFRLAPSLGVEVSPINLRDAGEIEPAIAAFVRSSNDGLIVTGSPLALGHRDLIFALAARYKLPAVYGARFFAAARKVA
jgi:hypothetical protein